MRRVRMLAKPVSWIAVLAVIGAAVFGAIEFSQYRSRPLVQVVHLPATYPRRGASLSANVTMRVSKRVKSLEYRLNGNDWHAITNIWSVRFVNRIATLEMPEQELKPGLNHLELVADAQLRPEERQEFSFSYDPSPIALPLRRAWKGEDLEAQDGSWEALEVDGDWRVRPEPGYEGYDRILLVTGAFPVPRRIETFAVFRRARRSPRNEIGFGVLSLWGGHPGPWSELPRGGWSFAMGLYWSKPGGVGAEISYADGSSLPKWVNSYRDSPLLENVRYRIVIEVDEVRVGAEHDSYLQRVKIWPESSAEPDEWIVLTDKEGARLPEAEYAVALFALDSQVEFGPVDVLPLPAAVEAAELSQSDKTDR